MGSKTRYIFLTVNQCHWALVGSVYRLLPGPGGRGTLRFPTLSSTPEHVGCAWHTGVLR